MQDGPRLAICSRSSAYSCSALSYRHKTIHRGCQANLGARTKGALPRGGHTLLCATSKTVSSLPAASSTALRWYLKTPLLNPIWIVSCTSLALRKRGSFSRHWVQG